MTNIDPELIKLMVREEVQRQMDTLIPREIAPMRNELGTLVKTVRSFYSNGSGGPPGALEIWREEDKQRFDKLEKAAEVAEVNNDTFLKFIARYDEKEAKQKERWNWTLGAMKIVIPAIGTILIALCGFLYSHIYPVVKAVWTEYEHNHPAVTREIQEHSSIISVASSDSAHW